MWDTFIKQVQKALQRKRRKSRGDRSPIELTTSIVPTPGVDLIISEGLDIRVIDDDASAALDQTVTALLEQHWDLADTIPRAKSQANRRRTDMVVIPRIYRGDYVLYAVHVPDTKLDYVWPRVGRHRYFTASTRRYSSSNQ